MKIDGKEYILSPRRAGDVLALSAGMAKRERDGATDVIGISQGLCDSLVSTRRRLGLIRGFHYRRFGRKGAASWILDKLSMAEIFDAWSELQQIEGGSKKKAETENGSETTSQDR
jgi:hypothetical protein